MVPNDDSFISDDEEEYCPICVEEMDIYDKNFKPCPCGYQICQFCYNNIRLHPELNGRCPGCRRVYDDESVEYKNISPEELKIQQVKKEKREKERKLREKEKKESELASKKHLAGLRVVQKNLVYVTGLNPPCNPEDLHSVLRSDKYFGQYGKILKIVINKKTPNPLSAHFHHQNPGLVVYVTFAKKEDALKCITELDGSLCDGRVLRAAHGTTKYCSSYLRGHACSNPNCMFLHEPGEEADSYTRKDLSTQQGIKMSMMGMSGSRVGSSSNISGTSFQNASNISQNNYSGDEDAKNQTQSDEEEDQTNQNTSFNQNGPVLPATAHWAKGTGSTSTPSPSVSSANLNNPSAFPTLGEIFRDQKAQARKDLKQKSKSSRSLRYNLLPNDIDIEDQSTIQFIDEVSSNFKAILEKKEKLQVHFSNMSSSTSSNLPLFAFNPKDDLTSKTNIEEEKIIARQIIERFILRPIKNYHLAYQNHPIAQQSILQAQFQQQQLQQKTPSIQSVQLQQMQLENQKKLLETQQGESALQQQQQQQQQLLLLQQQQQHQQQQSMQQISVDQSLPNPQSSTQQVNLLRLNERTSTSTPPPPGLYNASGINSGPGQIHTPNQKFNQVTSSTAPINPIQFANQSSSSQLLTQLMSGKR